MTAYLNDLGLLCALGQGQANVAARLFAGDCSGMQPAEGWIPERRPPVGAVRDPLPTVPLPAQHSRNNQLLYAAALQIGPAIERAITQYGAHRVAVVIGTSTSGIAEASECIGHYLQTGHFPAHYHYAQQELSAPAEFLADWLQLSGPAYVISTACTSSGRALLSARRLLELGQCDAVLCGGVDSLCGLTLNGFSALEAVSEQRCNPFSANRDGINIGEGAALFLMTRERNVQGTSIALLGAGASSDAHHISAPDPTGAGALQCMGKALDNARLTPAQIDYLNLHGTATAHNDAMESLAVQALFGATLPCSSTKPMTGHTLGAAGALEAAFCWLSLSEHNPQGLLPPHVWDQQPDPALPALALADGKQRLSPQGPRRLMSNSFAFGGNNVSLILGDTA